MLASPLDPAPEALPPALTAFDPLEEASHRRAMPVARLVSGGMRADDAAALHALSEAGIGWIAGACWLAARSARIAAGAASDATACIFYRNASAALRFGQCALSRDDDRKRALHAESVRHFAAAALRDDRPVERHAIAWGGGSIAGWLVRPNARLRVPVVIVFGGFDGWREDYHAGAAALAARGIAVYLTDLPGQGEARLVSGLFLDSGYVAAIAAIADYLTALPGIARSVGIWGNSLGGYLAARAAGEDPRYAAVCVNGGSARPLELPDRHPRFWPKVSALTGTQDRAVLAALDPAWLGERLVCPLLQLHGAPDTVFLLESARVIHDAAGSTDKTLLVWPDGDHCLYNHPEERDAAIGDFFATRLV